MESRFSVRAKCGMLIVESFDKRMVLMKKVILIPDSFKGTMSSREICGILKEQVLAVWPQTQVLSVPVADGGEGSVDAFLSALGGERVKIRVKGPYFEEIDSFYGILPDGTAVIEMAAAAGLPLVGERKNPEETTTYGVGQLMADALERGFRKIILGLGGSATNDGGCGAAAALGIRFLDEKGKCFIPVGGTLGKIASVDGSGLRKEAKEAEITVMCDIDNPLCGEKGAAAVFAPQKGADEEMVRRLDEGLLHLAQQIRRDLDRDILQLPGAGAAGGMGGGMAAFLDGRLQMGIETVLDAADFGRLAADADLVITGEGRLDSQSLGGKAVVGVAKRAKKLGVPVVVLTGDVGDGIEPVYALGVTAVFSINRVAKPFAEMKKRAKDDLAQTAADVFRLIRAMKCRE